jgi:hypothetical protein
LALHRSGSVHGAVDRAHVFLHAGEASFSWCEGEPGADAEAELAALAALVPG